MADVIAERCTGAFVKGAGDVEAASDEGLPGGDADVIERNGLGGAALEALCDRTKKELERSRVFLSLLDWRSCRTRARARLRRRLREGLAARTCQMWHLAPALTSRGICGTRPTGPFHKCSDQPPRSAPPSRARWRERPRSAVYAAGSRSQRALPLARGARTSGRRKLVVAHEARVKAARHVRAHLVRDPRRAAGRAIVLALPDAVRASAALVAERIVATGEALLMLARARIAGVHGCDRAVIDAVVTYADRVRAARAIPLAIDGGRRWIRHDARVPVRVRLLTLEEFLGRDVVVTATCHRHDEHHGRSPHACMVTPFLQTPSSMIVPW